MNKRQSWILQKKLNKDWQNKMASELNGYKPDTKFAVNSYTEPEQMQSQSIINWRAIKYTNMKFERRGKGKSSLTLSKLTSSKHKSKSCEH